MDRYQKFICEKAKKKRDFMGKMFFPRTPVVLLDFSKSVMSTEYKDLIKGLETLPVTTLVVPPEGKEGNALSLHSKNIRSIAHSARERALEAADIIVVLDGDIGDVWESGCVPVAKLEGESTVDYNPLRQKGNGFYFKDATKWEVFGAVVRALETYQFPYDWENLIRGILLGKA